MIFERSREEIRVYMSDRQMAMFVLAMCGMHWKYNDGERIQYPIQLIALDIANQREIAGDGDFKGMIPSHATPLGFDKVTIVTSYSDPAWKIGIYSSKWPSFLGWYRRWRIKHLLHEILQHP